MHLLALMILVETNLVPRAIFAPLVVPSDSTPKLDAMCGTGLAKPTSSSVGNPV